MLARGELFQEYLKPSSPGTVRNPLILCSSSLGGWRVRWRLNYQSVSTESVPSSALWSHRISQEHIAESSLFCSPIRWREGSGPSKNQSQWSLGDIFPTLMDKYVTLLAIPLTHIYNEITSTHIWPLIWKQEFVTVIPKCRFPAGLEDLRNISCMMLLSKIYESFIFNWLGSKVSCKPNQYGGVKGCGAGHLLADMWDEVCGSLEDARASVVITAVDYAKAFNRLTSSIVCELSQGKGPALNSSGSWRPSSQIGP